MKKIVRVFMYTLFFYLISLLYYSFSSCKDNRTNSYSLARLNKESVDTVEILSLQRIKIFEKEHITVIDSETAVYNLKLSKEIEDFVVKLYYDGFYRFVFWKKANNNYKIKLQDSIPWTEYKSDTLFDVNGDGLLDFVVNGQLGNGRYTPSFSYLYCYNSTSSSFVRIDLVSHILNPKFIPTQKKIVGEEETDSLRYIYNYIWQDGFSLRAVDTFEYHKRE